MQGWGFGPCPFPPLWAGLPPTRLPHPHPHSFIAVENIDSYSVLISSKAVYFLKSGDYVDREAIFLEVKYDDLYHCLVSKDHGKVYVQVTKKATSSSSGVSIPGPSHQKPMVSPPLPSTRVGVCRAGARGRCPCSLAMTPTFPQRFFWEVPAVLGATRLLLGGCPWACHSMLAPQLPTSVSG